MKHYRLLLSAVEDSGDRLAAALFQELQRQHEGTIQFSACGVAGPRMRQAGIEALVPMETISAMGFVEVLKKLPALYRARQRVKQAMNKQIHRVIGIDAPDFHLPLLAHAKAMGLPAIAYVSPQIWVWRQKRAVKIAKQLDRLLCLFRFEPTYYPQHFDARWVGHPVCQWIPQRSTPKPYRFGLLPGSRQQECRRMLPIFLQTAEVLKKQHPQAQFVLSMAERFQTPDLPPYIERRTDGVAAMHDVQAALTKSGTITLELALMGVPMVVAHRVHPITYWIGRSLIRNIKHIALPNILSGRQVVPEHIQYLSPPKLAHDLLHVEKADFNTTDLYQKDAIELAAKAIMEPIP